MPTNRKFGRLPDDKRRARVTLKPTADISAPASANWVSGNFPVSELGMLGNDSVGDCVFAGSYHAVDVFEWNGRNVTTNFTAKQVLADYSTVTGYKPSNPNSDQGATLQEGLDWWAKTGNGGYKIQAYAQIDNTNLALVQACIAYFGVVYAGLNVPSSAMTQFDAGQEWAVVSRSQIEGGHCVPLVGYDASSFTCITWAATQQMTTGFYQRYFDEAWVPISTDWLETSGVTPSGLDGADANAQFQSLTGSTSSPFPTTVTPPPVNPPPVNPPPVTDVDTTLNTAMVAWQTAKGFVAADTPPHVHGH